MKLAKPFTAPLFLAAVLAGYRELRQKLILLRTKIRTPRGIEALTAYEVDGDRLVALIRGKNVNNPVLLFVHGGPGMPDMPFARFFNNRLTSEFTIIHYDQRATGKSYNPGINMSSLTVEMYINDLISIAAQVRQQFPGRKIFLTGHSWGAFIAILTVNKRPELFDAYVGIGQVVNSKESDLLSYNYALKIAGEKKDIKSLKKLRELDPDSYNLDADQLTAQRKVLGKTGGRLFKKSISRWIIKCPLFSPEYSYRDLWYMRKTTKQVVQQLYPQMVQHNLFNEISQVPIPLFILGGWHDYQAGTIIAERFFNGVHSPLKEFYGFDRSGHFPHYEETEKYQQVMVDIKRKVLGFYK